MAVWIAKRALPRLGGRAMFDLPPPTPNVQVEFATTGMASGIAQTVGPQLVVRGGLDFKVFQLGTYAERAGLQLSPSVRRRADRELLNGAGTRPARPRSRLLRRRRCTATPRRA